MKELLNKVGSSVAGIGLFLIGCVMAGIGLSVVFFLAMFALAAIGLGILATPLLALLGRPSDEETQKAVA